MHHLFISYLSFKHTCTVETVKKLILNNNNIHSLHVVHDNLIFIHHLRQNPIAGTKWFLDGRGPEPAPPTLNEARAWFRVGGAGCARDQTPSPPSNLKKKEWLGTRLFNSNIVLTTVIVTTGL